MPDSYLVLLSARMFERGQDDKAHWFLRCAATDAGDGARDWIATIEWLSMRGEFTPVERLHGVLLGEVLRDAGFAIPAAVPRW